MTDKYTTSQRYALANTLTDWNEKLTFEEVLEAIDDGEDEDTVTIWEPFEYVAYELPTIIEAGVPGYLSTGWAGLMAPKGITQPVFDKLYKTLVKVMQDPATREQIERQGGDPVSSTPAEFARFIKEEYARFGEAIRLANLKVE